MVPQPSYPLFEQLTRLDAVVAEPYTLEHEGRWRLDVTAMRRRLSPQIRAILVVSPNNPTGSFLTRGEWAELSSLARSASVAIISDEVFAEYAFASAYPPSALDCPDALTFCLGGLSKSVGLPQVKLAWTAVGGPDALVGQVVERLEYISDAYLSVSSPVQHAAPRLLEEGSFVREAIARRVGANYTWLRSAAARYPSCQVLQSEGGWYVVIRVPAVRSEEALVLELLEADRVLVHPGYFFDFHSEAYLIVSLLPELQTFRSGISRLLARAAAA